MHGLEERIFSVKSESEFEALAMDIFHIQAVENPVYATYLSHLDVDHNTVRKPVEIPFLPIELFKSHRVITGKQEPSLYFESSGTTGQVPGRHYLVSDEIYRESFLRTFTANYGGPGELCILALLPSYLERRHSSLVYMMDNLIGLSHHPDSGFYLDDLAGLSAVLQKRTADEQRTLLLGVSFALLDLAEKFPVELTPNITVMETGGMKGRRREMIREELHEVLKNAFYKTATRGQEPLGSTGATNSIPGTANSEKTVPAEKVPGQVSGQVSRNQEGQEQNIREQQIREQQIHSEYGMTELLSQAYAKDGQHFRSPPWMRVVTRDLYDPLSIMPPGRSGGINVIDLANLWSCSFIATGDVGKVNQDGSFQVTGRYDQAEVRGCNLMVV